MKKKNKVKVKARTKMSCNHCGESMLLSEGQIAYWHKECRSEGRRLKRKHEKKDK